MKCCSNCFGDIVIHQFIETNGKTDDCQFCGKRHTKCVDSKALKELFLPVVQRYKPTNHFASREDIDDLLGDRISEKLYHDWGLFENLEPEARDRLLDDMFEMIDKDDYNLDTNTLVDAPSEYHGSDEDTSNHVSELWKGFGSHLRHENRFFPQKNFELSLLSDLLSLRLRTVPTGRALFRARSTHSSKKYPPSKMGKPPVEKTRSGRANPKGIAYLYLASDEGTALSEIRPDVGELVTIGRFRVTEQLEIVDLNNIYVESPFALGDSLNYYISYMGFLQELGNDLSKPTNDTDAELEYLPTQYLCEFIKTRNYDGVKYKSSRASGYNIALFNDLSVRCTRTHLCVVDTLNYTFSKVEAIAD
ncbi:MAG TPA: RES domain-containing protein [Nitrososphaerales archaeon]|nr:RES domain-containing protein [Nitrososphaerales archaeon]